MPGGKTKGKESAAKNNPEKKAFPVIGIGASAGGLEALETFFSHMTAESGMAFVVIQHLPPRHKSILGEILKKDTQMTILEIQEGMKIEPNQVYLNPPDKDVALSKGTFHLAAPLEVTKVRMPIDFCFRSLAEDQREKAVCIVLSGTGSDGTLGLEEVKAAGGLTLAQAEDQAKYPFMPRSAIDTGQVDYILPVEKMPEELIKYAKHPYLEGPASIPAKKVQTVIQKILMLIRTSTKHDFTHYKPATIRRRIERRMALHKILRIADYYRFLQENPAEVHTLFKDLVICVTSFFRDKEAFKTLETKVIPNIIDNRSSGDTIRIWVPGCGSGEEALSLAILLEEAMHRKGKYLHAQIFASDIDPDSIAKARQGDYPESIAADVTPERLKRFFVKRDHFFRVRQEIREMVVYAVQNIISDPPFSRLDMLSCRNVLIYMDQDLQKRLLPLFHFTLNKEGYLFLGTSETIDGFTDLYSVVDSKWKIYQRRGSVIQHLRDYPPIDFDSAGQGAAVTESIPARELNLRDIIQKVILSEYSPPSVLINSKFDILYFQGDTSRFLTPPVGEPVFNLLKMAREDLRPRLLTALHECTKEKRPMCLRGATIRDKYAGVFMVDLVVRPLIGEGMPLGLFLVIFEDKTPAEIQPKRQKKIPLQTEAEARIASMEQELQNTKEYLQTTVEELEASNEELQSTNEELQSTNEELQSTNEELETAKEELQSTNEELVTVNFELQGKVEELTKVNDDVNNLLSSSEVGTIFLDRELKIKRFTPAATQVFSLIRSDLGRSIRDITTKIFYQRLPDEAEQVLKSLQMKELDVETQDGKWFNMRLLPYRTGDNLIDGVVLTFMDITVRKEAEYAMWNSRLLSFAETLAYTAREPFLILNGDLKVIAANPSFYSAFKVTPAETEGRLIYELGNRQWDIAKLKELLEQIISKNKDFSDFEVTHNFPAIGFKAMLLNARSFQSDQQSFILLAIEDVTKDQGLEGQPPQKS
jgi:two-component system, chemotaxis family, CheB/CheR fusion protein